MSTEMRLGRLGLLHLQDKPQELAEALDKVINKNKEKHEQAKKDMAARLKEREALELQKSIH